VNKIYEVYLLQINCPIVVLTQNERKTAQGSL